ncbi:MAG: hypothetical protein WKH64_04020 [Chloroflexia bacterium]
MPARTAAPLYSRRRAPSSGRQRARRSGDRCRLVEDDPNDHTVGLGGLPNLVGEVELDASL